VRESLERGDHLALAEHREVPDSSIDIPQARHQKFHPLGPVYAPRTTDEEAAKA
jgi:hypothetical protein